MIVTCPACETRYVVADAVFTGAEGRRVRCASCGNIWQFSCEAEAIHEAIAEATAAAEAAAVASGPTTPTATPSQVPPPLRAERRAEPPRSPGPMAVARPSIAVQIPGAARRRLARLVGLSLIVLAVVVVLAAMIARDRIMAWWPASVPVYQTLHLIAMPGAGLQVTVKPTRTADALVITGDIVNSAGEARRIPKLRVALRDGSKTEVDAKVIDPPADTLPPGATAHFTTTFEHPSITATGVAVTFAAQ